MVRSRLNYSTSGTWCEECKVPVYQVAASDDLIDRFINAVFDDAPVVDDLAQALKNVGAGDKPAVPPTKGKPGNVQRYSEAGQVAIAKRGAKNATQDKVMRRIEKTRECGVIDGGTAEEMRQDVRSGEYDKIEWVKEQLDAYWAAAEDFERENGGI
jgi:signal recognition particle subunit SEC65